MSETTHTCAFVIGEALIDAVHDRRGSVTEHPGGSPANVALTLGRLGQSARLLSWFGQDERGQVISRWLEESKVTVDSASTGSPTTSVATAHIQDDGSALYDFDIEWDLADDASVSPECNVVHTGSISAVLEPGGSKVRTLMAQARSFATITYDPNARPSLMGDPLATRAIVEDYVSIADVVKVSDEDLEWLYPEEDPLAVAQRWQQNTPALVVVTKGGSGATAFADCGRVDVESQKVEVADTVGAGDSFMGALIYGLGEEPALGNDTLLGKDGRVNLNSISRSTLERVLDQCVRVAAITVSRAGANPPWHHEL